MSLVSSVRWVAIAQITRAGSQLAGMAILARLLPPQSYGLMAMAMTVTNLAFLFRDLGTSTAIVQCKHLSHDLKCTLYWLNLGLAVMIALVLAAIAMPLSLAYREPGLASIVVVLGLAFPISSLGAIQQALMERDSQFRLLARIEAVSAIGAMGLGLFLAKQGAGVWSLVAQMLAALTLTALQANLAHVWRPQPRFSAPALRSIFGVSAHVSLLRFLNYLDRNADSMVIGAVLGSSALGVYSMAYKVMLFPLQNIAGVATRALFPVLSRNQESRATVANLYLRATATVCTITAPLMAGLFFLREPFVLLVFGARWIAVADLLAWLAAVGFLQSIGAGNLAVFLAMGKSRLMLGLGMFGTTLHVAAFLLGARSGIEAIAASYFLAELIIFLPTSAAVMTLLQIAPKDALCALGKPLAGAAFMLLVLWGLRTVFPLPGLPRLVGFSVSIGIGALAYAFALMVLLRQDISDMRALLKFSGARP